MLLKRSLFKKKNKNTVACLHRQQFSLDHGSFNKKQFLSNQSSTHSFLCHSLLSVFYSASAITQSTTPRSFTSHTDTYPITNSHTKQKQKKTQYSYTTYSLFLFGFFNKESEEREKKKTILMGTEGSSVEISEPLLVEETQKIRAVEDTDRHQIPEWKDQITIRGLAVSAVLGSLFCIITHKLNLTVGIIPSLNVAAGLLGFFFVKSWTSFLSKLGFHVKPFTRQENTVIQTCVVACYGLAFSGIYPLSNSALRFNIYRDLLTYIY